MDDNTIPWLVTVITAFAGVGIGFFYQGKALMKPEEKKQVGRQLYKLGKLWMGLAFLWAIALLLLAYLF